MEQKSAMAVTRVSDHVVSIDDFFGTYVNNEIQNIVDSYIDAINKTGVVYKSTDIKNAKKPHVFRNMSDRITNGLDLGDVYGFIDMSFFENGKSGLVFTREALYERFMGEVIRLPYDRITGMEYDSVSLVFANTEGYGAKLFGIIDCDVSIISSYNLAALKECLERIRGRVLAGE